MLGVLLTQPARSYDVVPTDTMCAEMLAEFSACFSGERTVEQLTSEWKWGNIRRAFGFDFISDTPGQAAFCRVLGACPLSFETGTYFKEKEFLFVGGGLPLEEKDSLFDGRWPLVRDLRHCYWALGVKTDRISVRRQSLAFVYCSRRSAMYSLAHEHLGLKEPSYEDVQSKHPSLCWDTIVHDETQFEPSGAEIQAVPWGALNAEVDVMYLFHRRNCMGVMLLNRNSIPKGNPKRVPPSPDTATRDFSRLTEDFFWMPDRQIERFTKEIATLDPLARRRRDLSYIFNRAMAKHGDNGEYMKRLGFRFLGTLAHPTKMHYEAPWYEYSYYESPGGDMVLQSLEWNPNWEEKFCSFVLDVKNLPEEARLLLPYGLDIKPYLRTPPSAGVLYEHVRGDKRARIVVQPHIAYLYEDNRLAKILICNDEKGLPDHGWSLVRELFIDEETGYFWPVTRAYSPLEN